MSSSSKRFGEVIIISVIVFILFVLGIIYITKNIASLNNANSLVSKVDLTKVINDIKEENASLKLILETNLKEITSLIFNEEGRYKTIIINNNTGKKISFLDLIKDSIKFTTKEEELLKLKYPEFLVNDLKENRNNTGYKVYYLKENAVIIYYYDYNLSYNYSKEITLTINYNELKDNLKFTPILDSHYENEDGMQTKLNEKYVALTFDDGPSSKYNPLILNILKENKAQSTFFMVGYMMNSCQSCVLETYNSGNEIGSHSWEHLNIKTSNANKVNESLTKVNDLYHSITNDTIKLLRPPYGSYNTNNLKNISLPFILWNLDTEDWRYRDVNHIVNYIEENVSDGSIILMHELYETSYESLKIILPWLYANDYNIVTVSELARIKGVDLSSGSAYRHF